MNFAKNLKCMGCGKEYSLEDLVYCCKECGYGYGSLDVVYDYDEIARKISRGVLERRRPYVWKYRELLPILDYSKIVSLGEGGTPLLKCEGLSRELGIKNLYIKNETMNPTWTFKDRAFTVSVSKALEYGVDAVALPSHGNAAASASAYSAKAGLKCFVFIPAATPIPKITQVIMHGAKVISVEGSIEDVGLLVMDACDKYNWYNITTYKAISPYQTEGLKTEAYEICEQLGWDSPDWVLVPAAGGDNLGGIWKGFKEFHELGFVKNLPRMVAIQARGAAPLVRAFRENKKWFEFEPIEAMTIADSICMGVVIGPWPLNALRESEGAASAVSDEEILEAEKLLATKEGIFAEPASAATIAGLKTLSEQGDVDAEDTVVCVITGSGLKDVESATKICKKPSEIRASMKELDRLLTM